jgi:hypothetical protein
MFIRKIGMLVVGLALAGKDCGAMEAVALPKDSPLTMLPRNRIKKDGAIKIPSQKKRKPSMPKKKNSNKRKRNQNNPSEHPRTIDEIIHAVIGENGAIYSRPSEEIFDGSGVVKLQRKLGVYLKMVETKLNDEFSREYLEEILELVDAQIDEFAQLIYYAYFEMPNSSPESIENHNQYYGTAKNWFENIKHLIESKTKEQELENEKE